MRKWINLFEMSSAEAREVFFNLGVNSDQLGNDELKKEYRRLMMRHHPDRGGDEEIAKKLSSAYDTLKSLTPKSPAQEPSREVKKDFRDIDYIKQWFLEQSEGKPSQNWTVFNFDGYFFRGTFTVRGNHEMFSDMARIMRNWDSSYDCRAILVGTRAMLEKGTVSVIWCDGEDVKPMVSLHFDSFNLNPSNDNSFVRDLPRILNAIHDGSFVSQDMLD